MTWASRLLSPAGFALVLLCFFFPFVAVSSGTGINEVTVTFSGLAMITGANPAIGGAGVAPEDVATIHLLAQDAYNLGPLALIASVIVYAGMASALIRRSRARHWLGAALAVSTLALLAGAAFQAVYHLEHLRGNPIVGPDALAGPGVADTQWGFWLAVITLLALAAGHVYLLVRAPRAEPVPVTVSEPEPHDDGLFFGGAGEPNIDDHNASS
jgi:hypothetical protein